MWLSNEAQSLLNDNFTKKYNIFFYIITQSFKEFQKLIILSYLFYYWF